MTEQTDIVVSGHLCLDLLPDMSYVPLTALSHPGRLYEVGAMATATGGAVSNTGLALHRLGANVKLMATVGDDLLGKVIVTVLEERDPALAELLVTLPGEASSYSVVLSPENADRMFLHCTGTNTNFGVANIDFELIEDAKVFHLGYPPLLPRLVADDGAELEEIFQRAKDIGVVTSLDMAQPDPKSATGQANWRKILQRTLPYVDIFAPSIEEIMFMLRRDDFDAWGDAIFSKLTRDYLLDLADELLAMGPAVVGFKLNRLGMYLRTGDAERITQMERLKLNVDDWADVEFWCPAFQVDVVGTTGAGDATYAGLLAAMLRRLPPRRAILRAVAAGACNVEAADALSGVRTWEEIDKRLDAGWAHRSDVIPGFQPKHKVV